MIDDQKHGDIEKVEYLPFLMKGLTIELKMKAKLELFENKDTIHQSCRLLKSLLDGEKNFSYPEGDWFLLQFLRARKFDVKRAYSLCRNYFHAISKYEEIYDNFDFSTVEKTMNGTFIGFLQHRDLEGCAIIIIKTGEWNPDNVTFAEVMRTLASSLVHAVTIPASQIAGFKIIVDFKGFGMKQFTSLSPTYIWHLTEALQNCFPGRFRAIHIVNEGTFWSFIWIVIKQIITKKIKQRFQLHGTDMKKLHKCIPPAILPEEYDGHIGPFDNSEWKKQMRQHATQIAEMYSYGYKKKS